MLPGAEGFKFIVVACYALKGPDGSLIERDTAANYHLVEREGNLKIQRLEIYAVSIVVQYSRTFKCAKADAMFSRIPARCWRFCNSLYHADGWDCRGASRVSNSSCSQCM